MIRETVHLLNWTHLRTIQVASCHQGLWLTVLPVPELHTSDFRLKGTKGRPPCTLPKISVSFVVLRPLLWLRFSMCARVCPHATMEWVCILYLSRSLLSLICGHVACRFCLLMQIYNILRHIMSSLLFVVWFLT